MIKIPNTNKKFSQPNNSDMFGNIWYTKNINFDEPGYIKLSERAIAIYSEDEDSDFGIPTGFGRTSTNSFYIATDDDPFESTIAPVTFSIAQDSDNGGDAPPTLSQYSRGKWWQNRWHVTNSTKLYYKTVSNGNWTDTGVSLTTGLVHDIEPFRNSPTIAITNGSTVAQYSTSYSSSGLSQLSLPSQYEAIGLCFSGTQMGIITRLSSTAEGQNQESYFFTWSGSITVPDKSVPARSDLIVAICAYKSSWVILTRTGQLLYFNGGGWQELGSLPHYYKNLYWGDTYNLEAYGAVMYPEGDIINININNNINRYGIKNEEVIQNQPGGMLCYDPDIGIYHKYSPSISPSNQILVESSGVNTSTNIFTASSGTLYETGNPIKYTYNPITPISGLTPGKVYFIIKHNSTQFSLATTKQNAINGTKIDITSTGDTNNYFLALNMLDFGASRMERTGAVATVSGKNYIASGLVFGGELYPATSTDTSKDYLNIISSEFENRGYLVSPKITSENLTDNFVKVGIKYLALRDTDSIIVKYKSKDIVGIPVSTPQTGIGCTWTSSTTFTTTADISEAYTQVNAGVECDCEIIAGAGGGQTSVISSISYNTGTYTVTLAEEIEGAANTYKCDIIIDNWKKIGEITSANSDNFAEFSIQKPSKWVKIKVELRGVEVAIEEIQVANVPMRKLQ